MRAHPFKQDKKKGGYGKPVTQKEVKKWKRAQHQNMEIMQMKKEAFDDMTAYVEKLKKRLVPIIEDVWSKCELTLVASNQLFWIVLTMRMYYLGDKTVHGVKMHRHRLKPKMVDTKAFVLANNLKKFKLYLFAGLNPACWVFLSRFVHDQLGFEGVIPQDIPVHAAPFSLDSFWCDPKVLDDKATVQQQKLHVIRQATKIVRLRSSIVVLEDRVASLEEDKESWNDTFSKRKKQWQDLRLKLDKEKSALTTQLRNLNKGLEKEKRRSEDLKKKLGAAKRQLAVIKKNIREKKEVERRLL